MKVKIKSEVHNGRLSRNRNVLTDALKNFEGKEVTITIDKAKKVRSSPQNRYYYGVVIPLVRNGLKDITGDTYNNEQAHELLKHRFLNIDVPLNDGLFVQRVKSTTELDTFEMEQYLELCRTFAQEFLNVFINLPNEELEFELK